MMFKETKHAVIMTLPAKKFDVYGYCMTGFIQNWPKEVQGYAIVENPELIPSNIIIPDNLTVLNYDEVLGETIADFEARNKDRAEAFDMNISGNIGRQALRFARKAFAQLLVLENVKAEYIHYIDADLLTHKPYSTEQIEKIATASNYIVACTPRWWKKKLSISDALEKKELGHGYTETGYMIWNTKNPLFSKWVDLYKSCYDVRNKIFEFDAWHDCVAFDYATLTCVTEDSATVLDLGNGVRSNHPLVMGPMGAIMDHMKGKRKFAGFSHEMKKRPRK